MIPLPTVMAMRFLKGVFGLASRVTSAPFPWLYVVAVVMVASVAIYITLLKATITQLKHAHAEHLLADEAALAVMRERELHRREENAAQMAEADYADEQRARADQARIAGLSADLRAYRVRLRRHWSGACVSASAASDSGAADAAAVLRIRDAQRLVESAARADRQVQALQAACGVGR